MLVKEYVEIYLSSKPYKYQTKINIRKCIQKLSLGELEYETLTPSICWEKIESILNQNVRRVYAGYIRSVFKYSLDQIPVVMGTPRKYDLPTQEELHEVIDRSKYRFQLYLCMYAGLRIGEACAVVPEQVKKDGDHYWLKVDRAFSQDGKTLTSPKTLGEVMVPEWLAVEILNLKQNDIWKIGVPTKRITTACFSLSNHGRKIHINPHMLRHWFATDMIRRNVPVNVVMKQMRHKNINTTMQIYAQVHNSDFVQALPTRPLDNRNSLAKVVNLFQ
jgi:integrase